MFSKLWLWNRGARPVIYQSDPERELLDESVRWRHMRHELPEIDFTWEREWRLRCDELPFTSDDIRLVVPTAEAEEDLRRRWEDAEEEHWRAYQEVMAEGIPAQYHQEFPWQISVLEAG